MEKKLFADENYPPQPLKGVRKRCPSEKCNSKNARGRSLQTLLKQKSVARHDISNYLRKLKVIRCLIVAQAR